MVGCTKARKPLRKTKARYYKLTITLYASLQLWEQSLGWRRNFGAQSHKDAHKAVITFLCFSSEVIQLSTALLAGGNLESLSQNILLVEEINLPNGL
jgi:hypothetical protein